MNQPCAGNTPPLAHPCDRHCQWQHTEACLSGQCGFCGTELASAASGECRRCGRIVCEACDAGYDITRGGVLCQAVRHTGPAR
jgi:hypothetical protein